MEGFVRVTEIAFPVFVLGTEPSEATHETTTESTDVPSEEISARWLVESVSKLIEMGTVASSAPAGMATDAPLLPLLNE
jgi:hypothetical protein